LSSLCGYKLRGSDRARVARKLCNKRRQPSRVAHVEAEDRMHGANLIAPYLAYSHGVADYFLVRQARGPSWNPALGRREQPGWEDHVTFVDRFSADGRILLGGPLDEVDGDYVALVVVAEDEEDARALFTQDPWSNGVLAIESVERWNVWIGAELLPQR
jgi:uncharacterized protein YciI